MQHQKQPVPQDWHPADIKSAVEKHGWSFNQLGLANGYTSKCSMTAVLRRPWPKAEAIVAKVIGVHPGVIWPSRYESDQVTPNRIRGRQPLRPNLELFGEVKRTARKPVRHPSDVVGA